jgi:hypothetical protein
MYVLIPTQARIRTSNNMLARCTTLDSIPKAGVDIRAVVDFFLIGETASRAAKVVELSDIHPQFSSYLDHVVQMKPVSPTTSPSSHTHSDHILVGVGVFQKADVQWDAGAAAGVINSRYSSVIERGNGSASDVLQRLFCLKSAFLEIHSTLILSTLSPLPVQKAVNKLPQ